MGAEDEPAVQDVDVARTPPVRRGLQSLFSLPFLPQITSYISNLPARGDALQQQERVFAAWRERWQRRADARTVNCHVRAMRRETVLQHHLSAWFEHCEQISASGPSPESHRSEEKDCTERAPAPVALPPGAICDAGDITPTRAQDFLLNPCTPPSAAGQAGRRRQAGSVNQPPAARSPRKTDMRPAALVTGSGDVNRSARTRSGTASPARSHGEGQLETIANEPHASPRRAGMKALKECITKMQKERPAASQPGTRQSHSQDSDAHQGLLQHQKGTSRHDAAHLRPGAGANGSGQGDVVTEMHRQMSLVQQLSASRELEVGSCL